MHQVNSSSFLSFQGFLYFGFHVLTLYVWSEEPSVPPVATAADTGNVDALSPDVGAPLFVVCDTPAPSKGKKGRRLKITSGKSVNVTFDREHGTGPPPTPLQYWKPSSKGEVCARCYTI